MKAKLKSATLGLITLLFLSIPDLAIAQTDYQSNNSQVTIKGTSTLHDWEMTSSKGQTKASFQIDGNKITAISGLSFTVPAESLKSDRAGLDKNAYKALHTGQYKNIKFDMTSGSVTSLGDNTFEVKAIGNLSIAETVKQTSISATCTFNPGDKSIQGKGSTTFKMTAYNVKPPTVMLGTIKTGDEITIDYELKLTAQ